MDYVDDISVINYLKDTIQSILKGEQITGLDFSFEHLIIKEEVRELYYSISEMMSLINENNKTLQSISEGNLDFIFSPSNPNSVSLNLKMYKLIAENTSDVFWVLDIKTLKLKYISPSVIQLRGYTAEEAMNEYDESILSDCYQKATDKLSIAIEESKCNHLSGYYNERKLSRKDGSFIDIEIKASFIKDVYGDPVELIGVTRDISQRKQIETDLKDSQEQLVKLLSRQTIKSKKLTRDFKYIFEHNPSAIAFFEIIDNQILISSCNNRWANALGFDSEKTVGMNINQLDNETATLCRKYINWIFSENKPIKDICHWKNKELEILAIPLADDTNTISGCAVFANDITEKQLAYQKMRNLEKLITYTGIQVETRERRKLASDLHDNVGPLLSSMNMYLSSLSRKPEIQLYSEIVKNIHRILKETIASVREISNNISPQVLNNHGLIAALNVFFETKKNLISITVNSNIGDFRFSETKENMVYNILKEAFNNTIKYANARSIVININKTENLITVVYKDDGIGFNLEEKLSTINQSFGLFSMINRIKNMDAIYEIKTAPGKGFILEIDFLA